MNLLRMITRLTRLITILCVLVMFCLSALYAETIDQIIAVVNGEIITQTDVDKVLAALETEYRSAGLRPEELTEKLKQVKGNIISQMVEEKLILSEVKKYPVRVDESNIEARLEEIKKRFPSEKEFEQALLAQEVTLRDLRDRFREQELMKNAVDYFVKSQIKVDPMEIQQYFQTHQEEFVRPEATKVKSILIKANELEDEYKALERAQEILERLRDGADFAELALLYSQGASSQEAGNLGFIEKGQLIKEIDQAIFSLQPGEFTSVFKTYQGYRIFLVEEKRSQRPLTFAQAQNMVEEILYAQEFREIFRKWLDELKQKAHIEIRDETK